MIKWTKGRQDANYFKFKILESKWLEFDFYLIKVPADVTIPPHKDAVTEGKKHHRVNLHFGPGRLRIMGEKQIAIYYFRPDQVTHGMPSEPKITYILSFGWLTYEDDYPELAPLC